jgi:hypothetical protein
MPTLLVPKTLIFSLLEKGRLICKSTTNVEQIDKIVSKEIQFFALPNG